MDDLSANQSRPDLDDIRRRLFDAVRAQPEAQAYFTDHTADAELLRLLFAIASQDSTDTIRLQACYYIAQFPESLLSDYEGELLRLQAEEWESLSEHAIAALAKLRSKAALAFLIDKRLAPKLPWETKMLRNHLRDFLKD